MLRILSEKGKGRKTYWLKVMYIGVVEAGGGGYGITIGFVVTSLVYYWCTNGLSLYELLDTDLHLFTSFNAN